MQPYLKNLLDQFLQSIPNVLTAHTYILYSRFSR